MSKDYAPHALFEGVYEILLFNRGEIQVGVDCSKALLHCCDQAILRRILFREEGGILAQRPHDPSTSLPWSPHMMRSDPFEGKTDSFLRIHRRLSMVRASRCRTIGLTISELSKSVPELLLDHQTIPELTLKAPLSSQKQQALHYSAMIWTTVQILIAALRLDSDSPCRPASTGVTLT